MFKILLIEDDRDINFILREILSHEGYEVLSAKDGVQGLELYREERESISLVLLDLMLPGLMGEDIIRIIREESTVPIIAITGKASLEDKIEVLSLGCDDYMVKPFACEEVLARVKAQIRRHYHYDQKTPQPEVTEYSFGELLLSTNEHRVTFRGEIVHLTQTQFALLKTILAQPTQVFSRDQLYRAIWGEEALLDDNSINVHMSNLRRKLQEVAGRDLIETVWGIGYRLKR